MTKPNSDYIVIEGIHEKIESLLHELVLEPRSKAIEWAKITKQTPNLRIGYPGQHLASLVTGMEGHRTGARGHDLSDGTEVKSCSRIDQLDKCEDCGAAVARIEDTCPKCNSSNVDRKNDSKWLFAVRNKNDLRVLTQDVPRILLILGDYPRFEERDFTALRFQTFEIWNHSERHRRFPELMKNYYHHIYLPNKQNKPEKTPAPKNFWPYSYQFYLCNPIKTFEATIEPTQSGPKITVQTLLDPSADRADHPVEPMPSAVANGRELDEIFENAEALKLRQALNSDFANEFGHLNNKRLRNKLKRLKVAEKQKALPVISEELRGYLDLRKTDKPTSASTPYARRAVK